MTNVPWTRFLLCCVSQSIFTATEVCCLVSYIDICLLYLLLKTFKCFFVMFYHAHSFSKMSIKLLFHLRVPIGKMLNLHGLYLFYLVFYIYYLQILIDYLTDCKCKKKLCNQWESKVLPCEVMCRLNPQCPACS